MNANNNYTIASKADSVGGIIFYIVVILSISLLFFQNQNVASWIHLALIVLAASAIVCTVVVTISQTEGNRILRATQLSDAFGAGIGEAPPKNYYNNELPRTARRLAATTLENTLFTRAILSRMLRKERVKIAVYGVVLLSLLVCRSTPTGWLLLLAQTLFSADLILKWMRLERFRSRTCRVYAELEQFFLQGSDTEKPNHVAILLSAFTDYECAKDEAVVPLDKKSFAELNPSLSREWEEMQQRLGIASNK